jgi:hypothetical protein
MKYSTIETKEAVHIGYNIRQYLSSFAGEKSEHLEKILTWHIL